MQTIYFTKMENNARARSEFFFRGGVANLVPWGGVTVMEKREIFLVGWVTKVCLKCTKKLG